MSGFSLILDLDETLIHYLDDSADINIFELASLYQLKCFMMGPNCPIVVRPYLSEFLTFATQHFDNIYIYTAAEHWYGHGVAANISKGLFGRDDTPFFTEIWTRNDCTIDEQERMVYKSLRDKLTKEKKSLDNPHTFIIDDREEVSHTNVVAKDFAHHVIKPFRCDKSVAMDFGAMSKDRSLIDAMEHIIAWKNSLSHVKS